ncbi:MAG: hypothetical protein QM725_17380 [Lacibacter sp.]
MEDSGTQYPIYGILKEKQSGNDKRQSILLSKTNMIIFKLAGSFSASNFTAYKTSKLHIKQSH